jgi:hypothetical protein
MREDNFNDIDIDRSGKLDKNELDIYYGKINYMDIADLNKDEELDYLEFERLKNIKKFGIKNGGNLFVRNAVNMGLLDKNSILAEGQASIFLGNKGFDPLNCSTDIVWQNFITLIFLKFLTLLIFFLIMEKFHLC